MRKILKSLTSLILANILIINCTVCLSSKAYYEKKIANYPVYQQTSNECWAYSILSMANCMYGGYSINDIINAFNASNFGNYNWNGATDSQAYNTIQYIFTNYYPSSHNCLTSNEIKLEINSNYPVYISGDRVNSSGGHAVALMGYKSISASADVSLIYYMNSATNSIMYNGYVEGASNTFHTNNSQVYNWTYSVTL
jgi:hypothetical protein